METLELLIAERHRELASNDPAAIRRWPRMHDASPSFALEDPGRVHERERHRRPYLKSRLHDQANASKRNVVESPLDQMRAVIG